MRVVIILIKYDLYFKLILFFWFLEFDYLFCFRLNSVKFLWLFVFSLKDFIYCCLCLRKWYFFNIIGGKSLNVFFIDDCVCF